MDKKTTFTMLLILVFVGIIGISAYFINWRQAEPVNTSTWKTYRNENWRFELKYPSDWKIEEEEGYIRLYNPKSPFTSFEITRGLNPERLPLDEWFEKATLVESRTTIDAKAKPTIINSIKFYKLNVEFPKFPGSVFKAFTANPQRQILIILAGAETSNDITVLETILSTFRFSTSEV